MGAETAPPCVDGEVVTILGPDDEPWEYLLRLPDAYPPPALAEVRLVKLDAPREGTEYVVRLLPGRGWKCSCEDHLYRNRACRKRQGPCKHAEFAEGLRRELIAP